MRQVLRYEADDGEVFETPQRAIQHELETFLMGEAGIVGLDGAEAASVLLSKAGKLLQIASQLGCNKQEPGYDQEPYDELTPQKTTSIPVPSIVVRTPTPTVPKTPQLWEVEGSREKEIFDATQSARMSTNFSEYQWFVAIQLLIERGLTDRNIRAILISDVPSWVEVYAHKVDNHTLDDAFQAYIDHNPNLLSFNTIKALEEAFLEPEA